MKKLNVIIILIDGGRLDRIMNSNYFQSLKSKFSFFSNSITYSPHTIAAMHAVFSGCYGTRTGTNSYWSTYRFKKNRFKTLTEYLKDLDYYTCADLHSEIVIPKQGFDKFVTYDEDKADIMSRHSDLIENFSKTDKNFFLYLHYSKIHTGIRDSVLKVYTNFSEEYFKNRKLNEQRYDKLFKESEIYLKNILDKIYSVNLHKNSLILIMSDHGISVGEKIGEIGYGAFCYDYTLRTFAFISWPKIKPIEIHQQVRSVDFMPTVLDLLGIVTDSEFEQLDGESLIPLQIGKKMKEKIAYSETGNPFNQSKPPKEPNTMSVRTSKWKLIQNKHNNTEELYDLENDPNETTNLAGTNLDIEDVLRKELVSLSG
jgi:arylsulfatase A-like enzyme